MVTSPRRSLAKNQKSIFTISIYILGAFIGICFNIYLSRVLGSSSYGNFKVAEAFFYFSGIIAVMGGASAAPKFLLSQMKNVQQNGAWHYVKFYSYLAFAVTIILAMIVFIGHEYQVSTFDGTNYHPMLFAVVIIPFFAVSVLLSGVLQSAEKLELSTLPWALGYGVLSLVTCISYQTFFGPLDELKAIQLTLLVVCLLTFFNIFFIHKLRLMPIKKAPRFLQPKTWLTISIPMMVASSLQYLMQKLDIFMIELLIDEIAVGHYAAAQSIDSIFYNIQLALIAIYSTKIADCANRPIKRQVKTIIDGLKLSLRVCIPFALLIFFYGHDLLMVFEHDTPLAFNSLIILMFGYIPVTVSTSAIVWLQYNGRAKVIMYLLIVAVLINAGLNWLMIPMINIEGASAATSIAMIFTFIGFAVLLQRELKIFSLSRAVPVS